MPLSTHLSNPSLLKAEAAEGCWVSKHTGNTLGRHAGLMSLRTASSEVSKTEGTPLASGGETPMTERQRVLKLHPRWLAIGGAGQLTRALCTLAGLWTCRARRG